MTTEQLETTAENQQQEQQTVSLNDLKAGYIVGLTDTGEFVFEIVGKDKGLMELLGLHSYAGFRIEKIRDLKEMSGDALVHEVGKAVSMTLNKLDELNRSGQVSTAVARPNNNL